MEPLIQNEEIVEDVNVGNLDINNKQQKKNVSGGFTPYLTSCLLIAVLGGSFQFGWNIGVFNVPSAVIEKFYKDVYFKRYNETMSNSTFTSLWSLSNGMQPLGGIIGGLSSGFVGDFVGRKFGLWYTNIIVLLSCLLMTLAKFIQSYEILIAGRFVSGIFAGLFSGLVPMYLNEIAPQNLRGLLGTSNQLFLVIGIAFSNIFGLKFIFGTEDLWPLLTGALLVPAVVHLFGLFFATESPKYLFSKNRKEEARLALSKLRGPSNKELVENEIQELEEEIERSRKEKEVTWADMFLETHLVRPLIVTIVIQMSQQLSGVNAVIFYSNQIFTKLFPDSDLPSYFTIIISAIQIVMTLVCAIIIEKAGRKILLLAGMIGMCVSSFVITVSLLLTARGEDSLKYLSIIAVFVYIVFFAIGPGAIPWLITSELFASNARGKATSIAVLANWASNALVTFLFPIINDAIKEYTFLIFGNFLILFTIFMFFFVPETKNKSTDEIISLFKNQRVFYRQ